MKKKNERKYHLISNDVFGSYIPKHELKRKRKLNTVLAFKILNHFQQNRIRKQIDSISFRLANTIRNNAHKLLSFI